jgi:hypothetical protein
LIDYLKNNLDTIILDAVNRVVQTKGINVDSGKDANKTDY